METAFPTFDHSDLGKVEIAPEVIQIIAGYAAGEVEGVEGLAGNFASGIAERFGRKALTKGVKVELGEEQLVVDVSIIVQYGIRIPDVAVRVQSAVAEQIENMTGLTVLEVNVHVVHVLMQTGESSSDEIDDV